MRDATFAKNSRYITAIKWHLTIALSHSTFLPMNSSDNKHILSLFMGLFIVVSMVLPCYAAEDSLIYRYSDGSGNLYVIQFNVNQASIEYNPVQKKASSSGVYSGGQAVKKNITQSTFHEIESVLKKAMKNKNNHIKNRVMMSGLIIVEDKNNNLKKTYILRPRSEELIFLDEILKKVIKR